MEGTDFTLLNLNTYLEEISLAGYRSYDNDIEQNTIRLGQVNVIIGANGAGKSNLISFLEMVAFMMSGSLRYYIAKQGGAHTLLHFGPSFTERICGKLRIHDAEEGKKDLYSFSLSPSATDQMFYSEERMEYRDRFHDAPYVRDFGQGNYESGMSEANDATARTLKQYLGHLKVFHFNDTSISSRIRGNANLSDDGYLRADGGNIAAFLYRLKGNPDYHPYYVRILRNIRMVMPQFSEFHLERDFGDAVNLRWTADGSDEIFGAHQLSDGTLRFIALTTLLLQPPQLAPMTIILDEPEIGLHPYALSVLAGEIRMASKTSQIIISTQSPLLLNHFSCDDIITAEYDMVNKRSVLHRHSEEELSSWLKDYSLGELWEKNVLGGMPL